MSTPTLRRHMLKASGRRPKRSLSSKAADTTYTWPTQSVSFRSYWIAYGHCPNRPVSRSPSTIPFTNSAADR
jgi:hypothetical protein